MKMKTKNQATLPENYREFRHIDLQKNKKLMLAVNIAGLFIILVLGWIGHMAVPLSTFYEGNGIPLRYGVILGGYVLYIILHEAVHGIFMRVFGCGVKPTFGFTGVYAFAASKAYFNRTSYFIIGFSPVVIWGIVLLILNLVLPTTWFWPIYLIQLGNIGGAAGDFYVGALLMRMPKTMLVQDDGVAMTFYLLENEIGEL